MAKRRKSGVYTVDFTGVKSGGRAVRDGRYKAKIIEWEEKEGQESGEPYLQLKWEITSDKCNGATVSFDNYSLQPQALWRFKGLLESLGEGVPDSSMDIDMDDLVDGPECIIEVTNQASNDDAEKKYPRVTGTAPLEDGGTVDDDEDDEPPKKRTSDSKKTRSSKTQSKEADDGEDDDDDDEDEKPARKRRASKDDDDEEDEKPARKKRASKDDDEDDEDDDDEEDEKPRSSGTRKLKKGASVKFKDEKGKPHKGTVESIDGDTATVVDEDEETWEIDCDELTVI